MIHYSDIYPLACHALLWDHWINYHEWYLSACALLKTKGTDVVSQNDQLLQLIELFVKRCQYFVLLEQSNGSLITNRLCFDFWKVVCHRARFKFIFLCFTEILPIVFLPFRSSNSNPKFWIAHLRSR